MMQSVRSQTMIASTALELVTYDWGLIVRGLPVLVVMLDHGTWRMEAPVATLEDVDARLAECAESCWHAMIFKGVLLLGR